MQDFVPGSVAAATNTRGVVIRFELKSRQVGEEKGVPVFKDVEYIEKRIPGDRTNIVFRPMEDEDRREYAAQYQHWLKTREDPTTGHPLKEWPPLVPSQVDQLAFHGVKTVEELAGLSDSNCASIGSGTLAVRQKAKDWLERAKGAGPESGLRAELAQAQAQIQAQAAQIQDLVAKLKPDQMAPVSPASSEVATLKAQMAELLAAKAQPAPFIAPQADGGQDYETPEAPPAPKKRGRKPKAAATTA